MNHQHQEHAKTAAGEIDPVCGMTVDPAHAAASSRIGDRTFYFCSIACKQKFDASPQRYLDDTDRAQGRAHRASQ